MANGKKGILAEFQEFISRGNVMDLAVGVIIGGAFTAIVNSLVTNVISPLISFITGGSTEVPGMAVSLGGNTIDFGAFLGAVINFLITAAAVFAIVKSLNALNEMKDKAAQKVGLVKDEAKEEPPPRVYAPTAAKRSLRTRRAVRTAPQSSMATRTTRTPVTSVKVHPSTFRHINGAQTPRSPSQKTQSAYTSRRMGSLRISWRAPSIFESTRSTPRPDTLYGSAHPAPGESAHRSSAPVINSRGRLWDTLCSKWPL